MEREGRVSYEDAKCPCGGRKQRETMLCDDCMSEFARTPAGQGFAEFLKDRTFSEYKRHCAMRLCSMARHRNRGQQLTTHPQ